MNSTTTSEELLRIEKLNLTYRLRYHQQATLRDTFVQWMRRPWEHLLPAREAHTVLRNIDLRIHRGDRLALLGVNGSGKTSLCRCVVGMLTPASGRVEVRGSFQAIFNARVGIIPELTGRENARLLARMFHPAAPDTELDSMVSEALEFSELGHFLDVPFENYSRGMQARLFLSVITARSTDLLVLDEVYDDTDLFFRTKMTERLHRFIRESGAVIFVSHSPELIGNICNRAIVLHEAKIAYDGEVEKALEVYRFLNAGRAMAGPADE